MKKGEIYLFNFDPSMGREYRKVRPALVVQSSAVDSFLVTVIPFSSQIHQRAEGDILVPKDAQNRLFQDSLLKMSHISSFDKSRSLHFIGNLHSDHLAEVNTYLKSHFEL